MLGEAAALPLPSHLPQPDADGLLAMLLDRLDGSELWLIAQADDGHAPQGHARMLQRHLGDGWARLGAYPREVLELTRWDQPPHEPTFERRHWRRAFACAALLRAYGEASNHGHLFGQNTSLAGLIDSLDALADMPLARPRCELVAGLAAPAAASLAWLISRLPSDGADEAAFFGLGLLWFALALDVPDAALVALADWIMLVEDEAAAPWRGETGARTPSRWLLDATCYDLRHDLWRDIGRRLPGRVRPGHGSAIVEAVELIAAMIADRRRA